MLSPDLNQLRQIIRDSANIRSTPSMGVEPASAKAIVIKDARQRLLEAVKSVGLELASQYPSNIVYRAFHPDDIGWRSAEYRVLDGCRHRGVVGRLIESHSPSIQSVAKQIAVDGDFTEAAGLWGVKSWAIALGLTPATIDELQEGLPRPYLVPGRMVHRVPDARRRVCKLVSSGELAGNQNDRVYFEFLLNAFQTGPLSWNPDDVVESPEFCTLAACVHSTIVFELHHLSRCRTVAFEQTPDSPEAKSLSQRLVSERGFTVDAAQWGVETWAMAFGLLQLPSAVLNEPLPHPWIADPTKTSIQTGQVARHLGCWPHDGFYCFDCQSGWQLEWERNV